MKKFVFVVCIFLYSLCGVSQTISNVDANQEGQAIAITFTMDEPADVNILYSTAGVKGTYVQIPNQYLQKVPMQGTQYKYLWDVLEQLGDFTYENVVFKVEVFDNGYVDLGLSVKWATCNVGAGKPWEYGGYFTFEEAQKQGQVPTKEEFQELLDKCTWQWTTLNGVNGYRVTARNGNSIFLPAAGSRFGTDVRYVGFSGLYWSSSANYYDDAYYLAFGNGSAYVGSYGDRRGGLSVRLVLGL